MPTNRYEVLGLLADSSEPAADKEDLAESTVVLALALLAVEVVFFDLAVVAAFTDVVLLLLETDTVAAAIFLAASVITFGGATGE